MARSDSTDKSPATNDAYTGMLAISLIALLVGCALLYLDFSQYPDKAPKGAGVTAPPIAKPADQQAPADPGKK